MLGGAVRPKIECLGVVLLGCWVGVQSGGAVAGLAEGKASPTREISSVHACRPSEVERRQPVMGEHLGMVFRASETLYPLCDRTVLFDAVSTGDLPVGDVANEGVGERELGLAFDGRSFLTPHEPFSLE